VTPVAKIERPGLLFPGWESQRRLFLTHEIRGVLAAGPAPTSAMAIAYAACESTHDLSPLTCLRKGLITEGTSCVFVGNMTSSHGMQHA
jgi:hypothetical protein